MAKITGTTYENGEIMSVFVQALDEKPRLFEPARARGEWVTDTNRDRTWCSVCNVNCGSNYDAAIEELNFCPNCGAKMDSNK